MNFISPVCLYHQINERKRTMVDYDRVQDFLEAHGMEPERFCICLMVLLEVGLLSPGSGGGIFGAVPHPIAGKADLESTRLIRLLRSM